jgi:hypothetical protein
MIFHYVYLFIQINYCVITKILKYGRSGQIVTGQTVIMLNIDIIVKLYFKLICISLCIHLIINLLLVYLLIVTMVINIIKEKPILELHLNIFMTKQ